MLRTTKAATPQAKRLKEFMQYKGYNARDLSISLCGSGCYESIVLKILKGETLSESKMQGFKRKLKKYHNVDI